MVCRARGSHFCTDKWSELDASDWPEHAPSKNQHMVPAYRMSARAMRRRGYQQGGHELLGGVTNTPSARDYYRKPCGGVKVNSDHFRCVHLIDWLSSHR
jgi:hypothetical protein